MTDAQHIAADYVATLDDAEFQAWVAAARNDRTPGDKSRTGRQKPMIKEKK